MTHHPNYADPNHVLSSPTDRESSRVRILYPPQVNKMAEIGMPVPMRYPLVDNRESRATVCALCVWVIVLTFCLVFFTMEHDIEGIGSAVAYLVMLPFAVVFLFISIYKIGKALLNLYKNR